MSDKVIKYKEIKRRMEEGNISRKDMLSSVGISEAMLSYILNGLREPSITVLLRIAKRLGCSVAELIEE